MGKSEFELDEGGEPIDHLDTDANGKPDFTGNHGCCRDCICLIIFLACIVAVIVIFAFGFKDGHPSKLITPLDSDGHFCGLDDTAGDYPDLEYLLVTIKNDNFPDQLTTDRCIKRCWEKNEYVCTNGTVLPKDSTEDVSSCIQMPVGSIEIVYRCFPDIGLDNLADSEEYKALLNVFTVSVNDFMEAWWVLLVAAGAALVLSFAFMCCMRICGKCIVWLIIIVCIIGLLVVGGLTLYYGLSKYNEVDTEQDETSCYVFIGFGAALLLAGIILFLIVLALRSRISLAITLIGEATKVFSHSFCLCLVPLFYILLFVIAAALLVITMVFYFSSLEMDTSNGSHNVEFTTNTRYVVIFMLLMFFWVGFFILGLNQSTIAGTAATWFFAGTDASGNRDVPTFPIARSLKVLILHHLGSVAFGSLLIAIICTIRAIVLYLEKKLKESGEADKQPIKCLFACLNCCLACCQKIVEYITSRAYIMMMIRGKNFISSAVDAIKIMLRNPLRTTLLTGISTVIVLTGIILVTVLATLVCVIILRPDFIPGVGEDVTIVKTYYWWLITLTSAIIAFGVAYLLLGIYDFLIDSVFLCFLIDEEVAKSDPSYQPYSSRDLQQYFIDVQERTLEEEKKRNKKDSKSSVMVAV